MNILRKKLLVMALVAGLSLSSVKQVEAEFSNTNIALGSAAAASAAIIAVYLYNNYIKQADKDAGPSSEPVRGRASSHEDFRQLTLRK